MPELILIFFGIFFIIWGVFLLNPKKYEKLVKWSADLKGVKPAISKRTLSAGRTIAIVYIILGITLILFGVNLSSILKIIGVFP